jgi:hypothetical protein
MNRFVEYTADASGLKIDDLELEIPHPDLGPLKVYLHSPTDDELRMRFVLDSPVSLPEAEVRELTGEIANTLVDRLASYLDSRITGPVHRLNNLTSQSPPPMRIEQKGRVISVQHTETILGNGSLVGGKLIRVLAEHEREAVKLRLESTALTPAHLWRQYRFALESTDPVARFMLLYNILLQLCADDQKAADAYIKQAEPGVKETPRLDRPKIMETTYRVC